MIQAAKELYNSLEQTIKACQKNKTTSIAFIECCFQEANHHWDMIKMQLNNYQFQSEEAEIYFFRNIKPKFTSTIEYYGLLAHAHLFKESVTECDELKKFYNRELQRLEKFTEANHLFYEYYKSGATANDALWFTRAQNDGSNFVRAKPHDMDSSSTTRCDYLISTLLALERYTSFLQAEFNLLHIDSK